VNELSSLPAAGAATLAAAAVAFVVGLLGGRGGRGKLQATVLHLEGQLRRAEANAEEQLRAAAKMRRDHGALQSLSLCLPHVMREINRNDLEPSEVPRLILQLANAIFQPSQVLLYGLRPRRDGEVGQREIHLIEQRGFDAVPDVLKTIPIGHGKLGWVAQHELDMAAEDWEKLRRSAERVEIPDNHPGLQAEIIGPLMRPAKEGVQVLGVLALGKCATRPQDPKLMFQLVTNIGSSALISSQSLKRLRSMANHDGLTELLNKRSFLRDFGPKALLACERDAKPFSIFIFDLDHFKNYNDTNGHPAGDELLRAMARLIRSNLRAVDLACRYGGEEFVVAMPDADRDTALALAERMRSAVADTPFPHGEKQPLGRVTISGGVASFPKDGSSVLELLQRADEALYQGKKSGRNCITAYRGVEIGDGCDAPLVVLGDERPEAIDAEPAPS